MNIKATTIMNDKELADKVVALGVGKKHDVTAGRNRDRIETIYTLPNHGINGGAPKKFVRDWRVAGALLEMLAAKRETLIEIQRRTFPFFLPVSMFSDPRAIIEACVEALTK